MQRGERKEREGMQKMGREGRRGKAREEKGKGREWRGGDPVCIFKFSSE